MAQSISNLILDFQTRLKVYAPDVELVLHESWRAQPSAQTSKYREQIRQHLFEKLLALKENSSPSILDLNQQPQSENFNISISHCNLVGGYAFAPKNLKVGFDIEECGRNIENAARRISNVEEYSAAPNAAALWVAKESILKAIGLTLVSQAQLKTWETLEENADNFLWRFVSIQNGYGFVCQNSRLIVGLSIFPA